jgi:hypothetical protein
MQLHSYIVNVYVLCFPKFWLYQLFLERLYKTFKPTNNNKQAKYALAKKSGVNERAYSFCQYSWSNLIKQFKSLFSFTSYLYCRFIYVALLLRFIYKFILQHILKVLSSEMDQAESRLIR